MEDGEGQNNIDFKNNTVILSLLEQLGTRPYVEFV